MVAQFIEASYKGYAYGHQAGVTKQDKLSFEEYKEAFKKGGIDKKLKELKI